MRWTPARAARLGYLAGRGVSMESVLRDRRIGAKSVQALRGIATRWGLHFGSAAAPLLSIPLPPGDQEILEQAAAARGLSTASFAASLIHTIASERLFNAVLDDDRLLNCLRVQYAIISLNSAWWRSTSAALAPSASAGISRARLRLPLPGGCARGPVACFGQTEQNRPSSLVCRGARRCRSDYLQLA
jgi:hypothetical protein